MVKGRGSELPSTLSQARKAPTPAPTEANIDSKYIKPVKEDAPEKFESTGIQDSDGVVQR